MIFKYEELLRLRRAATHGNGESPRAELRALSAEFPGSLRELDRLPIREIERRIATLRGAQPDKMLETIALYHRRMREALRDVRTVRQVEEPPAGRSTGRRLSAEVLTRVSAEANVEEGALRTALGLAPRPRSARVSA
ncbi:MAG: hypothetical protein U0174_18585 [Polyangiaceae bacterium]